MSDPLQGGELGEKAETPLSEGGQASSRVLHVTAEQSFSGPLPPPWALREYEEIAPGAAERIIDIAEGEAKSTWQTRADQLRLAERDLAAEVERTRRGTYVGGLLALGLLVVALVLALEGATWPAVAAAVSQLAPMLAVLIPAARRRGRR